MAPVAGGRVNEQIAGDQDRSETTANVLRDQATEDVGLTLVDFARMADWLKLAPGSRKPFKPRWRPWPRAAYEPDQLTESGLLGFSLTGRYGSSVLLPRLSPVAGLRENIFSRSAIE